MTDVSFVDLVVRMLVSLAVVLGVMFGAYWLIRRRQGFGPVPRPIAARRPVPGAGRGVGRGVGRRSNRGSNQGSLRAVTSLLGSLAAPGGSRQPGATGMSRGAGNRRGLRVLGRVGVGRTTQVVAVQFAERVFLLAASDQAAPAVLAELDLAAWLAATEATDDVVPSAATAAGSVSAGPVSAGHVSSGPVSSGSLGDGPIVREPIDPLVSRPTSLLDSLREATTRRG